jgi:hypothetical protein
MMWGAIVGHKRTPLLHMKGTGPCGNGGVNGVKYLRILKEQLPIAVQFFRMEGSFTGCRTAQAFDRCAKSVHRRIQALIESEGWYTKY